MTPAVAGGHIQISSRPGAVLRPGESVALSVLKALGPNKWAVGIGGRVYPAVSDLDLSAGTVLRARVGYASGRVVLTIEKGLENPASAALLRQGLPDTPIAQVIARALLQSGRPVLPETVDRIKSVLARSRLEPRRAARLAALAVEKRIDLSSPGLDGLFSLLSFGEKGGGDPRRYRGRPLPRGAAALRRHASSLAVDGAAQPSALQVFNHARGSSPSWVVVPFLFTEGGESLAGTMKFLYDTRAERLLRFVLSADGLHFSLAVDGPAPRLSVFDDAKPARRVVRRGLDTLRAKFHNKRVEVDDTVHDGELFDGFTPSWEGAALRGVDAVG
jgi:hypothetical protein